MTSYLETLHTSSSMSARSKRTQGFSPLLIIVVIAAVVGGIFLLKSKSLNITTGTPSGTSKATSKPVATQSAVIPVSSGPVGRNGLRAYAGPRIGEVTLEWQRHFSDGENFSIHYGTVSKQYPYANSQVGYIATYTVKGLTPGTRYFFALEGIRVGNVSAGSDGEVSMVAPTSPVTVIGIIGPVGRNLLSAKPGPKTGQVTLGWTRYYPDTEKYHIVYGLVPGKYIFGALNAIDTTPQDSNYSYVVGALSSGTRYYFALEPQRNGIPIYTTAEVSVVAP